MRTTFGATSVPEQIPESFPPGRLASATTKSCDTGDVLPETDSSAVIRARVMKARERQLGRLRGEHIFCNAAMTPRMIRVHCKIDSQSERMLETAMTRLGLSARAYDRILKVSRTIADLEGAAKLNSTHVSEAVGYRSLDRTYWT